MGTIINPRLINHGKIEPDNRTKEMSFTSKSMTDGHKRFMDSFSHTYKFDKSKRWKLIKTLLEVKKPELFYYYDFIFHVKKDGHIFWSFLLNYKKCTINKDVLYSNFCAVLAKPAKIIPYSTQDTLSNEIDLTLYAPYSSDPNLKAHKLWPIKDIFDNDCINYISV